MNRCNTFNFNEWINYQEQSRRQYRFRVERKDSSECRTISVIANNEANAEIVAMMDAGVWSKDVPPYTIEKI